MSQAKAITADNFAANLKKALSVDKSLSSLLQSLLVFGLIEWNENQNSNWLTDVVTADFRGVRTAATQVYVEDHTELVLTKMQDGTTRFKREAVEGFEFKMPTMPWYEYSNVGRITTVDVMVLLKSLIHKIEAAEDVTDEKKVLKEGTRETADALLVYLKAAPALNRAAA